MTLSPVQAHQMRVRATQAGQTAALDEAQRALHWLHAQKGLLSGIQSHQARHAHKAQVLPEILPYIDGVLAAAHKQAQAGQAVPADPVLAHCAVWAIDAGDWPLAVRLAAHLIQHGLPMPDEFERTAATAFADMMSEAALYGRLPAGLAADYMRQVAALTQEHDMPDQSRAKVHKAIAYALAGKTLLAGQAGEWAGLDAATLAMALQHLTQAERLDADCGVKKDIAAVQKLLAQAAPEAPAKAEAEPAGKPADPRSRAKARPPKPKA